jgi:hydrogenase nickel incorporation protein HypA/HybF
LRQFVPDTLEFCWQMVTESTSLAGARLDIEHVPAEVECSDCGARSRLEHPVMICPGCASGLVTVVAGEECLITTIEVRDPETEPATPEKG